MQVGTIKNHQTCFGCFRVRQTQTADWQVNEVNILVKCSNRFPKLNRLFEDLNFRDRESVRAFHNNVYLVYLPVCSLRLLHSTWTLNMNEVNEWNVSAERKTDMSSLHNISNVNSKHRHQNTRLVPLAAASSAFTSLRKQPTFCDATTGFPAKWCLRNKPRKSILMTRHYRCHYSHLGSASCWLTILLASTNQKQYPVQGSDVSSVWNFFAHFSHFISCGNQSRCHKIVAGFTGYPLTSLVKPT